MATNGLEALQQLQASSLGGAPGAPQAPDIALVDIMMPIMDGLTFTRRYREWCAQLCCACSACACSVRRCILA
jgi:CheY-like chemotaxis protein